jgi:hypothetical protein
MKIIFTLLFLFLFSFAHSQNAQLVANAQKPEVLIIGVPFYQSHQLTAVRNVMQHIPGVELKYVCEKEKTFLLNYSSKQYPEFDFFVQKIKQVDSSFIVMKKQETMDEFINLCKDEIQKQ